jgi:hypothetical protein
MLKFSRAEPMILITALAAFAYLLSGVVYARYMADDFFYATELGRHGLLADQVWWYVHWSGRYSATLVSALAEWLGAWDVAPVLVLVAALWLAALFSLCRSFPTLAPLLLVATLVGAPSLSQSWYWQIGLVSYVAPLAVCTLAVGAITGKRPLTAALLCVVAAGFSETYVVAQTTALALALPTIWYYARPFSRSVLAAFGGSLIGLGLVAFAPGTAVRRAQEPPTDPAGMALLHGAADALALISSLAPILLLVALAGALLGQSRPLPRSLLLILPISVFLIATACIAASWYGEGFTSPGRTVIVPTYAAVCAAAVWGRVAAGCLPGLAWLRPMRVPTLIVLTVLIASGAFIRVQIWDQAAAPYAGAWDARDRIVRQSHVADPTIPYMRNPFGLGEPGAGEAWIGPAFAAYYHRSGVRVVQPRPSP